MQRQRARAEDAAEERILDVLVPPARAADFGLAPPPPADNTARQVMRKRLREGALDDKEIEIDVAEPRPPLEIMGPPGMEEMTEQLQGHVRQHRRRPSARRASCKIAEALKLLIDEEAAKLVNDDEIKRQRARQRRAERHRLHRRDRQGRLALARRSGADVSRQGVQRDLLPLVEGTTVSTKYGMVKTDHILFIASGAFHLSQAERPDPRAAGALSDPRRARLAVGRRLRGHPDADPRQPGQAVPGAAGDRGRDAASSRPTRIRRLAQIAFDVNERTENIGARRLSTVMERLLDEVSFDAPNRGGQTVTHRRARRSTRKLGELAKNEDLSRYIL